MVLAQRVHLDVLHQNHVPVAFFEESAVDDVFGLHAVALSEERQGLRHPLGCPLEPFAVGVIAEPPDHLGDELLERGTGEIATHRSTPRNDEASPRA